MGHHLWKVKRGIITELEAPKIFVIAISNKGLSYFVMAMIPVESNISLRVEDTGGNGKPIFFVHGWPLDLQMFEYQFTTLKENGYRCIALDLRGFGMSAKPWQDYTYDVFVDDIQKVMKTQAWAKICNRGIFNGWRNCNALCCKVLSKHSVARSIPRWRSAFFYQTRWLSAWTG